MATTITANGINFPDGSASAPSIGGTDTNTGLFTGSDIVGFATGGVERIKIDAQGDIFIGTTSDIAPANGTNLCVSDGTISRLILEKQSTIKFGLNVSNGFSIYDETNDAQRFGIDSNGNVSIGNNPTTHADYILHIEDSGETNIKVEGSTSTLGARISLQNNDTTANAYSQYSFNDAGGQSTSAIQGINTDQTNNYGELAFLTRNAQGIPPTERVRITSAGKVGINTTNPKEIFDSRGAAVFSGDHATGANAYGTGHGIMLSSTSGVASIKAVSNGSNSVDIRFIPLASGSSTEAMRINSSGFVGINKTSALRSGLHLKSHSNGWVGGILLEENHETKGWQIHPDDNNWLMFGYNSDVTASPGSANHKFNVRSTGDVEIVNGDLKVASGHGIDFSANSNAAGMTSELLDGYEEGTWTPTFSGYGGDSGSFTYAGTTSGKYTRIGNQVTIWWYCAITNMATLPGGTYLTINSLPFTHTGGAPVGEGASAVINWWNPQGAGLPSGDKIVGFVQNNTTRIVFGQQSASNIGGFSPTSFFGSTTGSNSSYMYGMTTYIA